MPKRQAARRAGRRVGSVPTLLAVFLAVCLSCSEGEVNLTTVLDRHTEARGGAEAIENVGSLTIDLEITEPDFTVSGHYVATRDGFMRIDVHAGNERVFTEALGPDGGWQMGADGVPVDLSPEGEEALRQSIVGSLYGLHELAGLGFEMRLIGLTDRRGERFWEIEQVAPDGSSKQVFIHAETYLVGREIATGALHPDVDPTETRQETLYMDHSVSAGVLFANRTERIDVVTGEILQTVVVGARNVNAPVDASRFLRPAPG